MLPFKQKLNFIIGTIPSNVSKGDLTHDYFDYRL